MDILERRIVSVVGGALGILPDVNLTSRLDGRDVRGHNESARASDFTGNRSGRIGSARGRDGRKRLGERRVELAVGGIVVDGLRTGSLVLICHGAANREDGIRRLDLEMAACILLELGH